LSGRRGAAPYSSSVTWSPQVALYSDGICVFCPEGLQTSCLHGGRYGFNGVDGGQGEAVRVPQADGTLVVLPGRAAADPREQSGRSRGW
jgi:threonine dehydrogenase-like Zn-dependent dehydrogenase